MNSCDLCMQCQAKYRCRNDSASLCHDCDASVHSANKLAEMHVRDFLCELCGERAASVFIKGELAMLCTQCDAFLHDEQHQQQQFERSPAEPFRGPRGPGNAEWEGSKVANSASAAEIEEFKQECRHLFATMPSVETRETDDNQFRWHFEAADAPEPRMKPDSGMPDLDYDPLFRLPIDGFEELPETQDPYISFFANDSTAEHLFGKSNARSEEYPQRIEQPLPSFSSDGILLPHFRSDQLSDGEKAQTQHPGAPTEEAPGTTKRFEESSWMDSQSAVQRAVKEEPGRGSGGDEHMALQRNDRLMEAIANNSIATTPFTGYSQSNHAGIVLVSQLMLVAMVLAVD